VLWKYRNKETEEEGRRDFMEPDAKSNCDHSTGICGCHGLDIEPGISEFTACNAQIGRASTHPISQKCVLDGS
jgi:hypothetical protein